MLAVLENLNATQAQTNSRIEASQKQLQAVASKMERLDAVDLEVNKVRGQVAMALQMEGELTALRGETKYVKNQQADLLKELETVGERLSGQFDANMAQINQLMKAVNQKLAEVEDRVEQSVQLVRQSNAGR